MNSIVVAAATVQKERSRRLSTAILNQVIREAVAFKSPPRTRGGKRGRVYYCTQVNNKMISQCFLLAVKDNKATDVCVRVCLYSH